MYSGGSEPQRCSKVWSRPIKLQAVCAWGWTSDGRPKSFQEQIPDRIRRSPDSNRREGLAWQSKRNSSPRLGAMGCGDKLMSKSLASGSANTLTMSACIPFLLLHSTASLYLSELNTEPLVSETKYRHATDGNWIPLISLNNSQQIKGSNAVGGNRPPTICWVRWHTAFAWPVGQRWRGCALQLRGPWGDSFISNVSIYSALNRPQMPSRINLFCTATSSVPDWLVSIKKSSERLLKSRDSWNENKVVFVFMNSLPEEITSAWLKSITAVTKENYFTSNDALNCVINMLSASKRQESFKKTKRMEPLMKVTGSGILFIKNISHNAPHWCSILSSLLCLFWWDMLKPRARLHHDRQLCT